MLKSVEETTLLTKLEELVQLAKKKKNVLEYKEIMDHLADLDLDPDRIDRIYEYLESQNIDILGNIEAEEEVEKELDLTPKASILMTPSECTSRKSVRCPF
jgi:RNA polymerase primary sigma factor